MFKSKQISPLQNTKGLGYKIGAGATTLALFGASFVPTFAAVTLSDAVISICNKIGTLLTQVFGPLCILVLGIAIISIMVGQNSKSAENGMSWAKRACGCFIAFNILGSVLTWGLTLFSNTNVSAWGTTQDVASIFQMIL